MISNNIKIIMFAMFRFRRFIGHVGVTCSLAHLIGSYCYFIMIFVVVTVTINTVVVLFIVYT